MAGIGFELKRLYGKKTLASSLQGTLYATICTIGPAILSAILMLLLKILLDQAGLTVLEERFYISSTTVAFVVGTLASVLFATPVSRYISDCIFLREEENICPSMFGVLTLSSTISGICMFALCVAMHRQGSVGMDFLVLYYLLGVLVTDTYSLMTYASALKHYKALTLSFLGGLFLAIGVYLLCERVLAIQKFTAACAGLVCDYAVIVFTLVYQCVRAFGAPKGQSFEFLRYFRKYPKLAIAGIAYTLGIYIPTLIYWGFSTMGEEVSVFRTTPAFDVCMFFAIVVNMPSLVIFVVKAETAFYDKYTSYVSALNNGTLELIEKERGIMARTLNAQLFFVYETQLIITLVLDCVVSALFPFLNASISSLGMVVELSLGLYTAFCMHFTIVTFYYFSDYGSAFVSALVFLGVTTACSFLACWLQNYYALPLIAGGLCGWFVAFRLLVRRMRKLDSFLIC